MRVKAYNALGHRSLGVSDTVIYFSFAIPFVLFTFSEYEVVIEKVRILGES